MEMFLMALCMSLLGVAVCGLAFGAATRDVREQPEAPVRQKLPLPAPQFFIQESLPSVPAMPSARVPIEVLLLQLERHVRLEQAAAETFLHLPTSEALHSRTTSPLVH